MCYRNVFSYNEQLGIAQQFIITFNLMFCVILLCHSQTRLAITGRTYQHVGHEGHHLAENYLQTWPTTLLVVSHDREFLNTVSNDIVHLTNQKLENYRGNYENFTKTREEKLKNQQREYEAQQDYRKHVQV